jgi:hypothetical protein
VYVSRQLFQNYSVLLPSFVHLISRQICPKLSLRHAAAGTSQRSFGRPASIARMLLQTKYALAVAVHAALAYASPLALSGFHDLHHFIFRSGYIAQAGTHSLPLNYNRNPSVKPPCRTPSCVK